MVPIMLMVFTIGFATGGLFAWWWDGRITAEIRRERTDPAPPEDDPDLTSFDTIEKDR